MSTTQVYTNGYSLYTEEATPTVKVESISPSDKKRIRMIREAYLTRAAIRGKLERTAKQLQAIDYLLGDKYRSTSKLSPKQRREDASVKSMSRDEFTMYLNDGKGKFIDSLLGDRETVEACKLFLNDANAIHIDA